MAGACSLVSTAAHQLNISMQAIAMCLIEFSERASYYGSTGPFTKCVSLPRPIRMS